MIKKFARSLLVGLAIAAAVQSAHAGVVGIPGTEDVQTLLGANDRGDLLWNIKSNYGYGLRLSTKDTSGAYTHTAIDATVPGKGWATAALANKGDAAWLGADSAMVNNIYNYDAVTRVARQLTFYTGLPWDLSNTSGITKWPPKISDDGNTAWSVFYRLCNGCSDGGYHIDYFDKSANQTIRLTATPKASGTIALNRNGDAYWFELATDGAWELRKFDVVTRATSIVTRRPVGTGVPSTGSFSLAANDLGYIVWTEVVAGTSQSDVFLFDASANVVLRVTNTPGNKYATRINAVGDIAWKNGPQVWIYDQRTLSAVLINAKSDNHENLALNDMGEVAWSHVPSEYRDEMHLYKRATASDVRVAPGDAYPMEISPILTGSGDLFYERKWGTDWKLSQIMRATRDFTCN